MQGLWRVVFRFVAVAVVAGALGGCGMLSGDVFNDSFWASSPMTENDEAEFGIAELARGNYVTAEGHFQKALAANPRDIDALLGSGILYQHTGQVTKAREMYEAVLALRPDESKQFVPWPTAQTRPASQIASVNLSLLETGGVVPALQSDERAPTASMMPRDIGGAPQPQAVMGRLGGGEPTVEVSSTGARLSPAGSGGEVSAYAADFRNIVSRFTTLRALRDQGLITPEEYRARRGANLGALLDLTAPPPAAGLDRPVPTTEQIAGRLRAISRALEMRAISVSQHAAERSMILDALLPAAPVVVENQGAPPKGLMEAADAVRRLEKLREGGFISSDEYARERQAIELAMRAEPKTGPQAEAQAAAAGGGEAAAPRSLDGGDQASRQERHEMSGPRPAVHLASYRSERQAERGWAQIRRAHGALIDGLGHEVAKVDLGAKGTYYRLKAGPLESSAAAKSLCGKLKAKRQFCQPSLMGG